MTERRKAGGVIVTDTRAGKPKGIFNALAVTYGTVDDFGSVWQPGVFDESLNRSLPLLCFGHDWSKPIGRAQSWHASPNGPVIVGRLDNHPDVPLARQVLAQIESGTLTDVSVGFSGAVRRAPTDDERSRYPGAREVITSATLDELSVVAIGAVDGAVISSVRSRPRRRSLRDERASLKVLLDAGRITRSAYRFELEVLDAIELASRPSVDQYAHLPRGRSTPARRAKPSGPDKPVAPFDELEALKRQFGG